MRFADPQWLWCLLTLPLFAVAAAWLAGRRRRALERFAGGAPFAARFVGQVSPHRRAIKALLLGLSLLLLPLTLARPQWGSRLEPVTRRGADLVLVLDTSASMAAEDLAPSRLAQAKHAVGSLLDAVSGDRVALVTFAGSADISCPLTVDHGAVRLFLDAVEVESVPVPGTALADALRRARQALRLDEEGADSRGRAIVLLTDGEDHEGDLEQVVSELSAAGVSVYAIGCGSSRGAPIPLRDAQGTLTGYKKDRNGDIVTTRLNEATLESIALESGGRYYRATRGEVELEEIAQLLGALSRGELGAELRTRYEERFQWPLMLGLLALTAESLIGDRRRRKPGQAGELEGRRA